MHEADTDGDGRISEQEFVDILSFAYDNWSGLFHPDTPPLGFNVAQ